MPKKGYKLTKKHKENISRMTKIAMARPEVREKILLSHPRKRPINRCIICNNPNHPNSRKWCRKCWKKIWRKEKHHRYNTEHTKKTRKKQSLSHGGTGILDIPFKYSTKFKKLRPIIRKRDNYTCQNCNMIEEEHISVFGKELCVHHIDYNRQNCDKDNLITLCNQCNIRANYNRNYWQKYFGNMLRESCRFNVGRGSSLPIYPFKGLKNDHCLENVNISQGGKNYES